MSSSTPKAKSELVVPYRTKGIGTMEFQTKGQSEGSSEISHCKPCVINAIINSYQEARNITEYNKIEMCYYNSTDTKTIRTAIRFYEDHTFSLFKATN